MSNPYDLDENRDPKQPIYWRGMNGPALALGYVCFSYANLELTLNTFIEYLLSCTRDARRAIVDSTGASIDNRCNLILKLASLDAIDDEWFEILDDLIVRVRQELAPERNRLVHDPWIVADEGFRQWDQRSFLKQPQAGKRKQLTPPVESDRTTEAMWDLSRRIMTVDGAIRHLSAAYALLRQRGQRVEFRELCQYARKRPDPVVLPPEVAQALKGQPLP